MEDLGELTFIFTGVTLILFGGFMEKLKLAVEWLLINKEALALSVLAMIAFAETIVRITPTKTDDGAVQRIGAVIKKIFDFLKLPNNVAK